MIFIKTIFVDEGEDFDSGFWGRCFLLLAEERKMKKNKLVTFICSMHA